MIPDDTPIEFTEGIARLFVARGMPAGRGSDDPETVILVTDDVDDMLAPLLRELLARHRRDAETPTSSMFRVGVDGRMVVVVMHTETSPDRREAFFRVSTVRLMHSSLTGSGLVTFVCLEDEWTPATGQDELPIQGRPWPRDN